MTDAEMKKLQAELLKDLKDNNIFISDEDMKTVAENLEKTGGGNYFPIGVHQAIITNVELYKTNSGSRAIRVYVEGEENEEANVLIWLSEKALPYSIERLGKIRIHNTEEDKRAEKRQAIAKINNAYTLFELAQALIGSECWLKVEESETQTYTDKQGNTKPSIERSIWGFEPKLNAKSQTKQMVESGEAATDIDPSEIPFN